MAINRLSTCAHRNATVTKDRLVALNRHHSTILCKRHSGMIVERNGAYPTLQLSTAGQCVKLGSDPTQGFVGCEFWPRATVDDEQKRQNHWPTNRNFTARTVLN